MHLTIGKEELLDKILINDYEKSSYEIFRKQIIKEIVPLLIAKLLY